MSESDRTATEKLDRAVGESMTLAQELFDALAAETADGGGVTRASYGAGEQLAHEMFAERARNLGLEVTTDLAGNGYYTLPGADRDLPRVITGSHLDSVPKGGNYDGAAGVVAGLAALAAMRASGIVPAQDTVVMAVRSEECSAWFTGTHGGHLGSRAALGLMQPSELDTAIHLESGKTLGEQMTEAGLSPARLFEEPSYLGRDNVKAYIELHIEQGPVLETAAVPVGIVTGIRGNARVRGGRCLGEYTHSGAVPQDHRHDAVLATAELILALDSETGAILRKGGDIVFAAGRFHTDAEMDSLSKVPGETSFTLDIRSLDQSTLDRMAALTRETAGAIEKSRGVRFDLGDISFSAPTVMDADHLRRLRDGCARLSIPHMDIASGGGHDAQEFKCCGIPSSMIFVRNANGSHNADEAMEMTDFAEGARLLAWMLTNAL